MVSVLLFYRRIRGDISRCNDNEDDIVNVPGAKLVWGPFHCPGIIGTLINGYAHLHHHRLFQLLANYDGPNSGDN